MRKYLWLAYLCDCCQSATLLLHMQSFNDYDDRINDNMMATTAYIENTLGDNTNHYNNLDLFMLN